MPCTSCAPGSLAEFREGKFTSLLVAQDAGGNQPSHTLQLFYSDTKTEQDCAVRISCTSALPTGNRWWESTQPHLIFLRTI